MATLSLNLDTRTCKNGMSPVRLRIRQNATNCFIPTGVSVEPQFFEDVAGNKYKMVGDKLYVMGWQDAEVKVRMVSEKTGKEVPTVGKKFQIYGWHLVNKVKKSESVEKLKEITGAEAVLVAKKQQYIL